MGNKKKNILFVISILKSEDKNVYGYTKKRHESDIFERHLT